VHGNRDQQNPPGAKDQKQLNRQNGIDDKESVGNTGKHLGPRERDE
jgi:hypothetical protein